MTYDMQSYSPRDPLPPPVDPAGAYYGPWSSNPQWGPPSWPPGPQQPSGGSGFRRTALAFFAIVCVGETESQRADGNALSICGGQIVASVPTGMTEADLAIGYEPLWAVGTGRVPTSHEIVQMHAHIRKCLVVHLGVHGKSVRILYGGSVNPADARGILALPGVGGALVGGASLKADDFLRIVKSAPSDSTLRLDVA